MAKESMKAREVKRAKMTARYAAKRALLKASGDFAALDKLPKKCFTGAYAQPLQINRPSAWIHADFRNLPERFPSDGTRW